MKALNSVKIWWAEIEEPRWARLALFLPYGLLVLFVLIGDKANALRGSLHDWVDGL